MLRISMTMMPVICLITGCHTPVDTEQNGKTNVEQTAVKENDDPLLIKAAEQGDTSTVLSLLQKGADINGKDERGRTAIMAATHGNHPETVKALIDAGADVNLQDDILDNPFLYAGAEGLLEIVKLTIDAGADTKLTNRYGGTALIPASEHAYVEVVKELLTHSSIEVNHVNNLGWTALLEAIILGDGGPGHQQVVQLLVDHGADVRIADKNGVTPLMHARERGFTEIEQMLLKESKNAGAFINAAEKGDTTAVLSFLKKGVDINSKDAKGRTAVMAATHGNHPETVKALIQEGADINIRDNRSDNPFLYAGAEGLLEILKLTIDAGADTKLTNRFNGTALIPASEHAHVEVVKEILERTDVDVNHINRSGWTALLEAIVLGNGGLDHQKVVQLLVDHGADVQIPDKAGVTPLQHAKKRGYTKIEQILLKAGAK